MNTLPGPDVRPGWWTVASASPKGRFSFPGEAAFVIEAKRGTEAPRPAVRPPIALIPTFAFELSQLPLAIPHKSTLERLDRLVPGDQPLLAVAFP
jgi:hypothetical protein